MDNILSLSLSLNDSFNNNINVSYKENDSLSILNNKICDEYKKVYNITIFPENIKLITIDFNTNIKHIIKSDISTDELLNQIKKANNIKIIIKPIQCNHHTIM